jgi:hypothetical protein
VDSDFISRLQNAIAPTRHWIEEYLQKHSQASCSVASLGIASLTSCYPNDLLQRARVVFVDKMEYPPMAQMGLPEFAGQEQMELDGITFDNIYFLRRGLTRESLHFHELIHVVQWQHLGLDNFLLAYGVGLAQFGYHDSPLEKMAYELQLEFEHRIYRRQLVEDVLKRTDQIWTDARKKLAITGLEKALPTQKPRG